MDYWMNHTLVVPREEDIIWKWNGFDTSQFDTFYDFDSESASFTGTFSMSVELDDTSTDDLKDFCLKVSVTNSIGMRLWRLSQFTQSNRSYIFIEFTSSSIGNFDDQGFNTDQNTKFAVAGVSNGSGGVDGNGLLFSWKPRVSTGHGVAHLATGSVSIRRFAQDSSAPFVSEGFMRLYVTKTPSSGSLFYRMLYMGNTVSQMYSHNSYSIPTIWNAEQDMKTACFGIYMTGSSLRHGTLYIKNIYVCKHPFDIT